MSVYDDDRVDYRRKLPTENLQKVSVEIGLAFDLGFQHVWRVDKGWMGFMGS